MKREEVAGQISLYTSSAKHKCVLPVDQLLCEVIGQARALRIPISNHIQPHVRINRRATGRFGACFPWGDGFLIELSDVLLTASEDACRQTLAHEVLHTCYGCQNHKKRWHHYAAIMNRAYGYHITRTDTPTHLGVAEKSVVRYVLRCTGCGAEIKRARRSPLVEHPERYRCANCGGRLILENPDHRKREPADDDGGTLL